ncbi:hypothetical protein AB0C61_15340 [Streptomyces sp. NPDC048680]|uniref:hypothetical protein n=1 Tax=Streptomyces sp. NPDC048680 TaxID=3155492 RepID=UPI003426CDBE
MSKTWPRHGIVKFAGTVMDGAVDGANGLLDCLARVEGKARETVLDLLEEEAGKKSTTGETAPHRPDQDEELVRLREELAALHKKLDKLAKRRPRTGATNDQPPVTRG